MQVSGTGSNTEAVSQGQPVLDRSALLEIWRKALTNGTGDDPREVVVAELAAYFGLEPDEVRRRCLDWETDSIKEWEAADRSSRDGLLDFYQTQTSWIFDTMWYHAQQYHGLAPAESVEIALGLSRLQPGRHLDFGAGPGSSSLFFQRLGWKVALADISATMLNFARWRLERHQVEAVFYDTSREPLPALSFDLITAFDVMVHVPDPAETLRQLHRALKPGGYLVFNIDNQPLTRRTQWHLYEEQYPILGKVRSIGFRRHPKISYFHVYQKVERSPLASRLIPVYDRLRYNRYVNFVGNRVRRLKRRLGMMVR